MYWKLTQFILIALLLVVLPIMLLVALFNPERAGNWLHHDLNRLSMATVVPSAVPDRPTASPLPLNTVAAVVTSITDGDTFKVKIGNDTKTVRLIGIDTPEVSGKYECFGNEATNKLSQLILQKTVMLEKDISETDKYGRWLRYVYVDNQMINELMVSEGYANAATYPPDVKFQDKFKAAEKVARENNRGLWNACKSASVQTPPPAAGSCKYSCSSPDRDCRDFSTQAEVQAFFNCCGFTANNDPMKLDGKEVGDGIPCESLP